MSMVVMTAQIASLVLIIAMILLSLAVLRRLNQHESRLARLEMGRGRPSKSLPPGSVVPSLDLDADDKSVTALVNSLQEEVVLAFVASGCGACEAELPSFVSRHDYRTALVVNDDSEGETKKLLEKLHANDATIPVLIERPMGPVTSAFHVTSFPTYVLIRNGLVTDSFGSNSDLPSIGLNVQLHVTE